MRTIKFRAWHKKHGMTHSDEPFMLEDFWGNGLVWSSPIKDFDYADFTFMQFTGLKDKNGTEIYEGDIVKNEKGDRAVIDYLEISTCFRPRGYYGAGVSWIYQQNTVIGNIYENPELLKEQND